MKLLVFCHAFVAYLVPDEVIEKAKAYDKLYHDLEGDDKEAIEFFEQIKKKYKPIYCGHLLTGIIG